jgi:pimeloyl-ACP methyl ester carboxylesterase
MSYREDTPSGFGWFRIVLWSVLGLCVIVPSCLVWSILPDLSDPSDEFYQRKGVLQSVDIESEWQQGNSIFRHITLQSDSGLKVKMTTRFPQEGTAQGYPLVLILGGERTGRDAIHLVTRQLPIVIAALSYPGRDNWVTEGVKRYDLRQYQQTERDTTPAVLLALDYLLAQSSVDNRQVELVGVSLGAFFVSMPAALDKRVTRTWLVHGAGEPEKVIAHRLKGRIESDVLRRVVAWASARLLAVESFRPENWLSRISPRKLVFINARDDEQLPLASVEALHRSASQPYEVIWTEGQHIDTGRTEIVQNLVNLIMDRVQATN